MTDTADKLAEALREIIAIDRIDIALDPQVSQRIAHAALTAYEREKAGRAEPTTIPCDDIPNPDYLF